MSLSDIDPVFKKFFDEFINKDHEPAKRWLKSQTAEDIKYFHRIFQSWHHYAGHEAIIYNYLESLESKADGRARWFDRLWGFVSGVAVAVIAEYLIKQL